MHLTKASGRMCAHLAVVLVAALAVGCSAFPLEPYSKLARDTSDRTLLLHGRNVGSLPPDANWAGTKSVTFREDRLAPLPLNRAAMLCGRSQAEIKARLEPLWRPSLRPDCLANYNGLIATRYSQLDTKPSSVFRPGVIVVEHLGRPARVPYIAAFHPGRRLPLVVGVSGINGTVHGKVTVDILQSLYDTGEFHVIHLQSVTSVDHQVMNQRPFLGGFPEGLLLYESLAELRTHSEFAGEIEQIHLVGVSFGGMLCGIAAHCEGVFQAGVVDGAVLAYSPPLDLKTLFDNIAVLPLIHDKIHKGYLEEGSERFIRTSDLGMTREELAAMDFDSYMRKGAFAYVQRIYPQLKADYPDLPPIETPEDLYAISSMRPFIGTIGVPYFYLYAYDDPVLSPEDHFHKVLMSCPNPLVDGMLLEDGGHLGFDAVCGFPFTSRVAERYFRYWSVNLPNHLHNALRPVKQEPHD